MKLIFLVFTFCWVFTSFTVAKRNGEIISRIVNVGEVVKLECDAKGMQSPTFTWRKLEGPLPANATMTGRFLRIPEFQREHSGTYRCTANNVAGSVDSDVQLSVQGGSDSSGSFVRTVNVGDRVEFECDVDLPTPEKLPFFYRLKKPLVPGDEVTFDVMPTTEIGGLVLFLSRDCCSDTGECLLENCGEHSLNYFINIELQSNGDIYTVKYQTRIPTEKSFSINRNQPFNIKVSWMNKSYEILFDGKFKDTVYYEYNLPAETEFVVSGDDEIVTNFEFKSQSDQKIADFQWTKLEEGPLPASGSFGRTFKIPIAHRKHSGTYRCTATNIAGSVESYVQLVVQGAPILGSPYEKRVSVGDRVVMECLVKGVAPSNVFYNWTKWYHDVPKTPTGVIIDGELLIIPQAQKSDSGQYDCDAESLARSQEVITTILKVEDMTTAISTPTPRTMRKPLRGPYNEKLENPLVKGDEIIVKGTPGSEDGQFQMVLGKECCISEWKICRIKRCTVIYLRIEVFMQKHKNPKLKETIRLSHKKKKDSYKYPAVKFFPFKKNQPYTVKISLKEKSYLISIDDTPYEYPYKNQYNIKAATEFFVKGNTTLFKPIEINQYI